MFACKVTSVTCFCFSVEESDISELDKRYWVLKSQSKTGKFDLETFKALVCPPVPETVCAGRESQPSPIVQKYLSVKMNLSLILK